MRDTVGTMSRVITQPVCFILCGGKEGIEIKASGRGGGK